MYLPFSWGIWDMINKWEKHYPFVQHAQEVVIWDFRSTYQYFLMVVTPWLLVLETPILMFMAEGKFFFLQ